MRKILFLLPLIFVGCVSKYSMPSGVNLNRYSYICIPAPSDFALQGTTTGIDTYKVREHVSDLFGKEGVKVLSKAQADAFSEEEFCKVLTLKIECKQISGIGSVSLALYDWLGQQVFTSFAEDGTGWSALERILNASHRAFAWFSANYSGFDPKLVTGIEQKLEGRETVDINETELRVYLYKNINWLDPIEGIWLPSKFPHKKIGIIRDSQVTTRDFIAILLEDINQVWKSKYVKHEFQKVSQGQLYLTTSYSADLSEQKGNATINDRGSLEIKPRNFVTGEPMVSTFIKLYPRNATGALESVAFAPWTVTTGTGFAVSAEGHVFTAFGVVRDATEIRVKFGDEDWIPAIVHKYCLWNNVAVLKLDQSIPNYLSFSNPGTVQTGQKVFALGYPAISLPGDEARYTEGIISSLSGYKDEATWMEISVPVQPGNSGGPLVDVSGNVVGMITDKAHVERFYSEIGTIPESINWALKADYIIPLLPSGYRNKPDTGVENTGNPIDVVKQAICLIEAK
jgi:S1-C subfamily serine protease